jgi:hypothetical protein
MTEIPDHARKATFTCLHGNMVARMFLLDTTDTTKRDTETTDMKQITGVTRTPDSNGTGQTKGRATTRGTETRGRGIGNSPGEQSPVGEVGRGGVGRGLHLMTGIVGRSMRKIWTETE